MSREHVIGGPLRVALTALGCKVNYAEMAELAGRLAAGGCEVVADDQPADVRVLNSCTVTLQADATTRQRLRRLRRDDPEAHVVITGCSVDGNPQTYLRRDAVGAAVLPAGVDAVFANAEKHRIADHVLRLASSRPTAAARTVPRRSRAFIKVQDGCDHRCTYCSVWSARGASRSLPLVEVLQQVTRALLAGHRELVLTGVDLGSYGRGMRTSLAALVATVLGEVGNQARIRLSSINSNDMTPALIELNAHPQLCAHWHMPLQSGSDAVLKAMHRGYRRRQYLRVCEQLRALNPDTELTTDVMVGFPGETEADQAQTVELIEAVEMLSAHVFRWSARPGTPAAALPERPPDDVARRRSAEVRRAAMRTGLARRARGVGRRHQVLWETVDAQGGTGLSASYLEVVAPPHPSIRPGALSTVTASSLRGLTLHGTVVGRG